MQPISLFDKLSFERCGRTIRLTTTDPRLPCDQSNLVVRAAESFRDAANINEGVKIHLEKRVPMEAGLGGGSSNAAATLLALNELFSHPLSDAGVSKIAASLGSDIPFFLQSRPALATGRGETIEPLEPFTRVEKLSLLLVHPGFGISTAWSYGALAGFPDGLSGRAGRAKELIETIRSDNGNWGAKLYNSLELPAFRKYPVLQLYVRFLVDRGAEASLMSGSGSTVYAYFESSAKAEEVLEHFEREFGGAGWTTVIPPQTEG